MAESEFRLPHEQLNMSEKNMPDLAVSEPSGMDQAQSSGDTAPSEERISNPSHSGNDRLDMLPRVDTSSKSQNPEEPEENQENRRRTESAGTSNSLNKNVPMEGPWTQQYANNRKRDKELRDQMGLPPEAAGQQGPDSTENIWLRCGLENLPLYSSLCGKLHVGHIVSMVHPAQVSKFWHTKS